MRRKKTGMIDVGSKRLTRRMARAQAFVKMDAAILARIENNDIPKGDILETARVAAILAAKKTDALIPLCHNIEITSVGMDFVFKRDGLLILSFAKAWAKTGVEMEAMVMASIAALTVYDMCKMFSKAIEISDIYLLEKRGGKSGVYKRK